MEQLNKSKRHGLLDWPNLKEQMQNCVNQCPSPLAVQSVRELLEGGAKGNSLTPYLNALKTAAREAVGETEQDDERKKLENDFDKENLGATNICSMDDSIQVEVTSVPKKGRKSTNSENLSPDTKICDDDYDNEKADAVTVISPPQKKKLPDNLPPGFVQWLEFAEEELGNLYKIPDYLLDYPPIKAAITACIISSTVSRIKKMFIELKKGVYGNSFKPYLEEMREILNIAPTLPLEELNRPPTPPRRVVVQPVRSKKKKTSKKKLLPSEENPSGKKKSVKATANDKKKKTSTKKSSKDTRKRASSKATAKEEEDKTDITAKDPQSVETDNSIVFDTGKYSRFTIMLARFVARSRLDSCAISEIQRFDGAADYSKEEVQIYLNKLSEDNKIMEYGGTIHFIC